MTSRFETRKQKILEQLDAPEGEYYDLSPKGSVDAPIRNLISEINAFDGIVTTSSCSGRISVFLEGRKVDSSSSKSMEDGEDSRAGPGGKGGGGTWLFISHDPVEVPSTSSSDYLSKFGLATAMSGGASGVDTDHRFIHLKFEPMILHILTASLDHAQRILNAGMCAGFRESGAVSLGSSKSGEANAVVAVRSTGYSFDSIIGYQDKGGRNVSLIDEGHLNTLVHIANERFKINIERIARFRAQLLESYQPTAASALGTSKPDWEDAEVRKQRKREEGLARQRALKAANSERASSTENDALGVDDIGGVIP